MDHLPPVRLTVTVQMRRKRAVATSVAVAVLVGAAVVTVVNVTHARATAVRMPPANAPSEQVLRVYLRAAEAHDCDLTEALTMSNAPESKSAAWCGGRTSSMFDEHPDLLAYRNIGAVVREDGSVTGGVVEECYPVDVTQTNMSGADPGVLPGWEFCLHRTTSGWRMYDEGYG